MNIVYKTAVGKQQTIEFCKIAKSNRLFVGGWNLICHLNSIVNGYSDPVEIEISLAYDGDKPIAIAFKEHGTLQCFVRAAYRRKGIGSQVIKTHITTKTHSHLGIDVSIKFWMKNKIPCSTAR